MTTDTPTIDVWDDESGVMYAVGHHEPSDFLVAVTTYIDSCGVGDVLASGGVTYSAKNVRHAWFMPDVEDEERMHDVAPDDGRGIEHTICEPDFG